jgi:hypothetical protein
MEILTDFIAKLEEVSETLPDILAEVITENETLIEDIIISQLQKGQSGSGETLPDYSPVSVHVYGKPPGPIKLFDTGAYYRGITARVKGQTLDVDNTDSKRGKIAARFGEDIIDIQEGNIEVIQETIILPGVIQKLENKFAA